ncbi:Kinesin-like protein KIF2A [Dirofilaria immitis]|nr:Kinesin-like protein KIF2A [Dirofilaria immitis]
MGRRLNLQKEKLEKAVMERINVGMHVDIRRSDGRVHNAVISEVRKGTQSGETKGKEIDLKTLLAINPTLAAPPPSTSSSMNFGLPMTNNENHSAAVAASVDPQQKFRIITEQYLNDGYTTTLSVEIRRQSQRLATSRGNNVGSLYTATNGNNAISTTQMNGHSRVSLLQAPTKLPPQKQQRYTLDPSCFEVDSLIAAANETVDISALKANQQYQNQKSSTVQEIERLQKNREERRAQQQEAKRQKEQLKSIDPGNPNWQFLTMIRDYQSQIDFRPLKISDQVTDHRICVCVRKRPLNRKEIMKKEIEVITIPNRDHLIVHQPQVKVDLTKYLENQKFRFDYTFDENTSNEMVYKYGASVSTRTNSRGTFCAISRSKLALLKVIIPENEMYNPKSTAWFTAQPLVRTIFEQGFATCFAYGQTGSGKTHTMGGDFTGKMQDCTKGIYALTTSDVFKLLHKDYKRHSLQVFDLIGNKAMLRVLEDGIRFDKKGTVIRTAGTTSANANSSRSHAVTEKGLGRMWGKFSLIDLAGNERGVDTINTDRQTRMEGSEINKSLLALKECIRAMGRNSVHVPFRASKLTLVLRDSFIGSNARTCMIAMISPGMSCCEHTLNTLRYADRVKELGAEEGSNTPMEDEEFMLTNIDEDYDILQSRNEVNDEKYRLQRTLQNIAIAEEKSCNELTTLYEDTERIKAEMASLLKRPSKIDYDIDAFATDLQNFAREQRDRYIRLYDNAECLVSELGHESEISKKQTNHKRH